MSESANWTTEGRGGGGGTVPSDKSQPTEKQQEGTIMTGPAHEKCQNPVIPTSRPICRAMHTYSGRGWGHDTDLNLDQGLTGEQQKVGLRVEFTPIRSFNNYLFNIIFNLT